MSYPWRDTTKTLAMRRALATKAGAGLGNESKMPGRTWGFPATECITGGKLQKVTGSTCSGCYAMKGNYLWEAVQAAAAARLAGWKADNYAWRDALVFMIENDPTMKREPYFRFLPQGDLQSMGMLADMIAVARELPDIRFWIPTREYRMVREYLLRYGADSIPANVTIRLSAHMVDADAPEGYGVPGITGSAVFTTKAGPQEGHSRCIAPDQDNECRDCRACWDRTVPAVTYHKH